MAQSTISTKQLEYLRNREHEFAKIKLKEDAEIKEALIEQYRKSLGDILNTINAWIGKYAEKNGITLEEARKKISSIDMKEFQEKAKQYVEDKDFSIDANAEMKLYNLNMRISRQELLAQEIRLQLRDLGLKEHQIMGSHLKKVAKSELERRAGILGLNERDKADIERIMPKIVNGSHLGAPFSDRIWQNKREVASKLVDGLERSLLRGERPDVWARNYRKMVKDTVNNSRYAAERLAYTEASIIQEEINTEAQIKAGYDSQVIITELGACDVCKPHDGKIVKIKDRRMGDNVPCWHPNCRCTTSSYYDDSKFEKMLEEFNADNVKYTKLNQAKGSTNKTVITDEAINNLKQPYVESLSKEENNKLKQLHQELLRESLEKNDSNEVGYAIRDLLNSNEKINKSYGDEDTLDINTHGKKFLLHNHPGNGYFSTLDIEEFIKSEDLQYMSVVANLGKVILLEKTKSYNTHEMKLKYSRAFKKIVKSGSSKELDKVVEVTLKSDMIKVIK